MFYFILLQATGGGPGAIPNLVMIGGIILIFYFFMLRPQQKKRKEESKFRESLKEGKEVMTIGGIYGKVESIKDNKVVLLIDRNTRVTVAREGISTQMAFSPSPKKDNKKDDKKSGGLFGKKKEDKKETDK